MSLSRPLRQTAAAFRVALFTVTLEIYTRSSPVTSARQHGRKPSRAGRKSSTITIAPHKYFLTLCQPPASKLLELTRCRFSMRQRVVLSSTVKLPRRIRLHWRQISPPQFRFGRPTHHWQCGNPSIQTAQLVQCAIHTYLYFSRQQLNQQLLGNRIRNLVLHCSRNLRLGPSLGPNMILLNTREMWMHSKRISFFGT